MAFALSLAPAALASAQADAGASPMDGGLAVGTDATVDAGVTSDAGAAAEADATVDAGVATDAGSTGDAGATADAGASADPDEDEDDDGTDWAALPVVVYTPETDLMLGAAGIYFFRIGEGPEQRSSFVRASGVLSTRGQWIVAGRTELWFDDNDWTYSGSVQYRDWPDSFYGIGNHTSDDDEEPFRLRRIEIVNSVERRIAGDFYVGLMSRIEYAVIDETDADGMLATNTTIPGRTGGFLSGIGLLASLDTRDSTAYATSGGYYHLELLTFQQLLGTDEALTYTQLLVDLRQFIPLPYAEGHALALQLLGQITEGSQPFNRLPRLGGSDQMRGYYEGRFRDNHLLVAQAEYRMPLFWRFKLAVFGSVGQVFRQLQDYRWDNFHGAFGLGLRFCASEEHRAHIRVDVAYGGSEGQQPVGIYFTILEAF